MRLCFLPVEQAVADSCSRCQALGARQAHGRLQQPGGGVGKGTIHFNRGDCGTTADNNKKKTLTGCADSRATTQTIKRGVIGVVTGTVMGGGEGGE